MSVRSVRTRANVAGSSVADHRRIADHIGGQDAGQTAVGVIHGRQIAALAGHSIVLCSGASPARRSAGPSCHSRLTPCALMRAAPTAA